MQTSALYRDWCHADVREQLNLRLKFPALGKKHGSTDDVENRFAKLTKITGYKPSAKKAEESLARAEMDLADVLDPEMPLKDVSLIQRTPLQRQQRRADWNDGQRVEIWWMTRPLALAKGVELVTVKRSFTIERAAWAAAAGKYTTVRANHIKKEMTNAFGLASALAELSEDGEDV